MLRLILPPSPPPSLIEPSQAMSKSEWELPTPNVVQEGPSTKKRDELLHIEKVAQAVWEETKAFEVDAPEVTRARLVPPRLATSLIISPTHYVGPRCVPVLCRAAGVARTQLGWDSVGTSAAWTVELCPFPCGTTTKSKVALFVATHPMGPYALPPVSLQGTWMLSQLRRQDMFHHRPHRPGSGSHRDHFSRRHLFNTCPP